MTTDKFLLFSLAFLSLCNPFVFAEEQSLPSADVDPFADEPPTRSQRPKPPAPRDAEASLKNALDVRNVGPGRFAVGPVIADTGTRAVTIPATAEIVYQGELVEYALVHESGDEDSRRPLEDNPWLYNGSLFVPRGFAAQMEGSIISLIGDLTALTNNIGADALNDEVHFPNADLFPPNETAVSVILAFPATDSHSETDRQRISAEDNASVDTKR